MFPDSKIAAKLFSKHTRTKSIIHDAIDPHLKKPVVDRAKASSFNFLCDESNERGDLVKVLTVFIRMFEPENGKIITRHLHVDTIGITDLTADGVLFSLAEILLKYHLPFDKLYI